MSDKNPSFDPGGVGVKNGNIFGFPYSVEEADLIIIPVPWDVTTSYQAGTSNAPKAILEASPQLDFVDLFVEKAWEKKIAMLPIPESIFEESKKMRAKATLHISFLEEGGQTDSNAEQKDLVDQVNESSKNLNKWLFECSSDLLGKGKKLCVLGGDHSSPLGFMNALAKKEGDFSILQIDAHADLREGYEDFEFSHASIMHNSLKIEQVKKMVQVGIRDLSPAEKRRIEQDDRVVTYYDAELKAASYAGKNWDSQCKEISNSLGEKVYISFDIDGLDPKLCPNTGTPVPGGMEMEQVFHLFQRLVLDGKKIIGFDLCEVNPSTENDWNENVGARVLFKLAALCLV